MPLRNSPSRDPNRAAPSAEGLRLTQADSLLAVSLLECKAGVTEGRRPTHKLATDRPGAEHEQSERVDNGKELQRNSLRSLLPVGLPMREPSPG